VTVVQGKKFSWGQFFISWATFVFRRGKRARRGDTSGAPRGCSFDGGANGFDGAATEPLMGAAQVLREHADLTPGQICIPEPKSPGEHPRPGWAPRPRSPGPHPAAAAADG